LAPSTILSKTSNVATTNDDQNSKLYQTDVARYEQCLQAEQKECEGIAKTRQEIYRQQVELWGVYKYGLEQIASLNDLGDAPDAILPGNFC
jgi:flagellar biosynthesis/type III secretory pathway protein FliH